MPTGATSYFVWIRYHFLVQLIVWMDPCLTNRVGGPVCSTNRVDGPVCSTNRVDGPVCSTNRVYGPVANHLRGSNPEIIQ